MGDVTDSWRIDVPMVVGNPLRPLTANDHIHWRTKASYVKTIREGVAWTAKSLHITVQLHYRPGDNVRRDAPNLTATSKPAIDGLVDAKVVPDDTAVWVTEVMPTLVTGKGSRQLWLTVWAGRVT